MRELPFAAVALTGSGSACFGLARDEAEARALAGELARRAAASVRVVRSLSGAQS